LLNRRSNTSTHNFSSTYCLSTRPKYYVQVKYMQHLSPMDSTLPHQFVKRCMLSRGFTVFVPSGNVFLTRRCRKLAQTVEVIYTSKSRRKPSSTIGIYVTKNIFEKAKAEFASKRAKAEEELWQTLGKLYPGIRLTDKTNIKDKICFRNPHLIKIQIVGSWRGFQYPGLRSRSIHPVSISGCFRYKP
jgi:hypothetical protein